MTRKEAAKQALMDLVRPDERYLAAKRLEAYTLSFQENVYCTWCEGILQVGPADSMEALRERMQAHLAECPKNPVRTEIQRLEAWIRDLQAGTYVNCVYCGHRYGPEDSTPVALAEVLKQHVQQCPKHPMAAMKRQLDEARGLLSDCLHDLRQWLRAARAMNAGELSLPFSDRGIQTTETLRGRIQSHFAAYRPMENTPCNQSNP